MRLLGGACNKNYSLGLLCYRNLIQRETQTDLSIGIIRRPILH